MSYALTGMGVTLGAVALGVIGGSTLMAQADGYDQKQRTWNGIGLFSVPAAAVGMMVGLGAGHPNSPRARIAAVAGFATAALGAGLIAGGSGAADELKLQLVVPDTVVP